MILGLGIDSVNINRFSQWAQFSRKKLQRIFSDNEIDYCLHIPILSAERFAARFAAREAFFKAVSLINPDHKIPFLTVCKKIEVIASPQKAPFLVVKSESFKDYQIEFDDISVVFSLTHSKDIATALVILQKVHV